MAQRAAIVTGASSGIGLAIAEVLGEEGYALTVAARRPEKLEQAAQGLIDKGYTVEHVAGPLGDEDGVKAVVAAHRERYGRLDVLVNNAGVGMSGRFLAMSPDDWEWILGINLMGVVHGCQAFGPGMVERGHGQVVNLSSGLAYTPRATEPGYVTTKAAVLALSRCLRADWGPSGVGVSAICPGVIATPIIERTRFKGDRAGTDTVGRVRQAFAKGHPPALVATAIVGAVVQDRPVVAVGIEARIGWALNGLLPSRVVDLMARATPGGI
jgi:NAD(P)-dependent dehydrogenase (short-subunit alcohol dehydrogenase family)